VKALHEIRDPVHNFIHVSLDERRVIDSPPVQRLRDIHQLAMSYLVYPGATHRRFEHSLGVMHLAGQVFDVITNPAHLTDPIRDLIPELNQPENLSYWRTVVRMAALCHDIGHLPFSHAAEHELLPEDYSHERLSMELIKSNEFSTLLGELTPPIRPDDLAKLSVGPVKAAGQQFSTWEAILSEIVVGDAFGVDRMDYLLRDSLHAGVQYGRFDQHRLIHTLRILPPPPTDEEEAASEPVLGVDDGGLHAAESLLLARYFMWTQVYLHHIRLVYDLHLQDYLQAWLPGGRFSTDLSQHLALTDLEVLVSMRQAAEDADAPGSDAARRIISRDHFHRLYERSPSDLQLTFEPGAAIAAALSEQYGADKVKHKKIVTGSGGVEFPVLMYDGSVVSSTSRSEALRALPSIVVDQVFIDATLIDEARGWLTNNKNQVLQQYATEEGTEQ
jgi:uncharacterized protein